MSYLTSNCAMTNDAQARDEARDFFDQEISKGDFVCYPTGGSNCRMVLAYVCEIHHGKNSGYSKYWCDGGRGNSNVRLKVLRLQEGTKLVDPYPTQTVPRWDYFAKKNKISVDQLHRCIKITCVPDYLKQIVHELGLPD